MRHRLTRCLSTSAAEQLAFDAAAPAVRAAVVEGLASLVQNPLTQPVLKVMLPKLRPLVWDSAQRVRVAVADLLLAVM